MLWPRGTNGALQSYLCKLWFCTPDSASAFHTDVGESIAQAQANLALQPASAYRWADLAEAELDQDQVKEAQYCIRQAVLRAPVNPPILFRAADFYLRLEDYPATFKVLSRILDNPKLERSYYNRVFGLYSEMDMPLETLLNQGLPKNQTASSAFLRYWIEQKNADEAQVTWDWMEQNRLVSLPSAGAYATLLAQTGQWNAAFAAWASLAEHADSEYQKTNWIYNSEFENKPVDSPFDWHFANKGSAEVLRDTEMSYRKQASLRITYDGRAVAKPLASQLVVLQPGVWTLRAMVKTRHVRARQSIVLRLVDNDNPANLDVSIEPFQGTDEWAPISVTAEVGRASRLARVEILRPEAEGTDSFFVSTIWIDSVTLRPQTKESVKLTGLTHAAQPCEAHGDCGDGESSLDQTAK